MVSLMVRCIICSLTIALASLLIEGTIAQAAPAVDQLPPSAIQRISRDLIRPSSRDFFEQGQRQLEQEVLFLTQRRLLTEGLLQVRQDIKIQQDLQQFERPDLSPSNILPKQQ